MTPKLEINYDDHVKCLYRVKKLCKLKTFRTVQHLDITLQYLADHAALKENNKLLNYLESVNWPVGMDTIRRNILQITSDKGNEFVVMNSLRKALQRLDPDILDYRDVAIRESIESHEAISFSQMSSEIEKGNADEEKLPFDSGSAAEVAVPDSFPSSSEKEMNTQKLKMDKATLNEKVIALTTQHGSKFRHLFGQMIRVRLT